MKVVVTGATGFIGKNLVNSLVQYYDVYIIARKDSDISQIDSKAHVYEYTGSIDELMDFFLKEKFNGIVHLASFFLASHQPRDIALLIDTNIRFATELLECAKHSHIKWFLNTGTFWQHYQNEAYNPVNLYAATKEAFETIAKYYTQSSNIIFTTLKLSDTFGKGDTRKKIFNLWQQIAQTGETLAMSKGKQIIDISYIEDVVNAYETLIHHLNSDSADAFNNKTFAIRSNERVSLKQLATIFEEATGYKLNIQWGAREYREREVMQPWDQGEVVPGWKAKYSLKEAIRKTILGESK